MQVQILFLLAQRQLYAFGKFSHDCPDIIQLVPLQRVCSVNQLETILETKRREVEQRRAAADLSALEVAARGHSRRPFAAALVKPGISIIAEMKRRSPSKGLL